MISKKRRLFYVILMGNVIILCNLFSVKPVSSFVAVGDNFHYEYKESLIGEIENLEYGSAELVDYSEAWSEDIHISEINLATQTILCERTDEDNKNNFTTAYGWESHIINYFDFTDLFYINYIWNQETDKPILRDFSFSFYNFRFVENNWSVINTHLSNLLNGSTIVDTVINPNDMSEHEITFGDFLGSLKSFKIQGRSSIFDAQKQFTDSTTKWSFKFDLSGVIHYLDHYNATFGYNIYLPVDKMSLETTIEYTEDGARKYRSDIEEFENVYSDDNYKLTEITRYVSALGKLPIQLSFSYLASIPAILFIVLVVRIRNKRK